MEKYIITGGKPLNGSVCISGAKNAAVAIVPAVILSDEPCIIENVPMIQDIEVQFKILTELGAKIELLDKNTVKIDCTGISTTTCSFELTSKMRASYYFMGALLSKYKHADIALPGGCNLGDRPMDLHIKGFEALGAKVETKGGRIEAVASELIGNNVFLDTVSVGATMNIILASVKAQGTTTIENAAKEPHIVDLANFLNSMGAKIKGAGTDIIKIKGVDKLSGTRYAIIPDQIEAGTYMVMAAATKGDVTIQNVIPKHLEPISAKLEEMNVGVEEGGDYVRIFYKERFNKSTVKTMPYPGFPTDMQPIIATLLALSNGTSTVIETVWDSRYKYVSELKKMGAKINVNGNMAVIEGVESFSGAPVLATDLRAGAAMLIAGLSAEGTTEISEIYHIDRGYERVVEKIEGIGGTIRRVSI